MKQIVKLVFAALAAALLTGCIYLPKAENRHPKAWKDHRCEDDGPGVVVAADPTVVYGAGGDKARCYLVKDTADALTYAVAGDGKKPLILFVHGRGAHPGKAIKNDLIYYLAEENDANVVMFHWPSYKGIVGYAKKSAWASAAPLETFLEAAIKFKKAPGSAHKGPTILLVHSMGNIVMRELALKKSPVLSKPAFDTLILNAPDVPWKEKSPPKITEATLGDKNPFWLGHIKIADQQFFHVSHKDTILHVSRWIFNHGVQRLGRCMDKKQPEEFIFVDFNGTGVNHLYYIDQGPKKGLFKGNKMKGNKAIKAYFKTAMTGMPVKPAYIDGLYDASSGGVNLWRFQKDAARKNGINCRK